MQPLPAEKTAIDNRAKLRTFTLAVAGGLLVSCLCGGTPAVLDRVAPNEPQTGTLPAAATRTLAMLETAYGRPYPVAAFPSGSAIFLISPQEEEVVADPWVDVVGLAPAETVISLNEEIAVAGEDGLFSARVALEEGLNEVQCVASDLAGNEVTFSFLIVYEPDA